MVCDVLKDGVWGPREEGVESWLGGRLDGRDGVVVDDRAECFCCCFWEGHFEALDESSAVRLCKCRMMNGWEGITHEKFKSKKSLETKEGDVERRLIWKS